MMQEPSTAADQRAGPTAGSAQPARLDGKTAIVTGGGGGIGRAIVASLGAAGAHVFVADLDLDRARSVADAVRGDGVEDHPVACDVTSPASVDEVVADAEQRCGRLDILVNNAGVIHIDPLLEVPLETWERVFAVNVSGALLMTQRAAKTMIDQSSDAVTGCRGKIVNISSGAANRGRPFLPAYGASKAALNHLSMTTSLVLAEHAVATTVLYPGSILAGMMGSVGEALAAAEGRSVEEMHAERVANSPRGRFQTPEEAADMVRFIVTFRGMGLNGHALYSDAHHEAL